MSDILKDFDKMMETIQQYLPKKKNITYGLGSRWDIDRKINIY